MMTLKQFAKNIGKINNPLGKGIKESNRDSFIIISGHTGEGKSTLAIRLAYHYSAIKKVPFSLDNNITYDIKEFLNWIGGGENIKDKKPRMSSIIGDEIISFFYKRDWYAESLKGAFELLNKGRTNNYLILGCVPIFWHIDRDVRSLVRYNIYCYRGHNIAHVFEATDNPGDDDPWNRKLISKAYNKKRLQNCPNYVTTLICEDLNQEQKIKYKLIRETKRKNTELQHRKQKIISGKKWLYQRNKLVQFILNNYKDISHRQIAKTMDIDNKNISDILKWNGEYSDLRR